MRARRAVARRQQAGRELKVGSGQPLDCSCVLSRQPLLHEEQKRWRSLLACPKFLLNNHEGARTLPEDHSPAGEEGYSDVCNLFK